MLKAICFALGITLLTVPAFAQTRQSAAGRQCDDQFKAADINNDGRLSSTEIGNAKMTVPSSLANKSSITRQEFISACNKSAPRS
jgi:hypothetical protein